MKEYKKILKNIYILYYSSFVNYKYESKLPNSTWWHVGYVGVLDEQQFNIMANILLIYIYIYIY